jgi:hypothetical protein
VRHETAKPGLKKTIKLGNAGIFICAAARILVGEGIDPEALLIMRYAGHRYEALRATIGRAARLTVVDSGGKPAFRDWQSYDGRHSLTGSPPINPIEEVAPGVASIEKTLQGDAIPA